MSSSEQLEKGITLDQEIELAILYEIATISRRLHNLDAIVDLAVDKAFRLLGSEVVIFYLHNAQENRLQARASRGVRLTWIRNEIALATANSEMTQTIVTWASPQTFPFSQNPLLGLYPAQAGLSVPIQNGTQLLGWLYAARFKPHPYTRSEISLYSVLANQVATTLEITMAWEQNRKQQDHLTAANQQLKQALTEIEQRTVKLIRKTNEAQKAREAAESANRAKSIFLANVSHELRTPLNAILGFAQIMVRQPNLSSEQKENLQIISRSGEHLLNLINDVLEISKIEAGRVTLSEQNFDLYRLLNDLEDLFYLRAMEKGFSLIFDWKPDMPRYFYADEGKLRQVLINLLNNAIKFTNKGTVTLGVGYKSHTDQPTPDPSTDNQTSSPSQDPAAYPHISFTVQDTGVGIGEDEIENLFEEFVQTRSGQHAQEGTGLGLPISRHFVRLMGGDISVHSKVGRGSVFMFDIPVRLIDASEMQSEQPMRRAVGLAPNQNIYRVLVVEDDWTNRKLMVKLLQSIGFEVREVTNGKEAVDIFQQWRPNLIWMDMRMPVMDGYEATRQIKAMHQGKFTTVIALTASAFEEQRSIAFASGCDDFVRKPFQPAAILEKMAEHLKVRFIFEDEQDIVPEWEQRTDGRLSNDELATLPESLIEELYRAAAQADVDLMRVIIEDVRTHNATLADTLTELSYNFRFDQIVVWTYPVVNKLGQAELHQYMDTVDKDKTRSNQR